MVIKFILIFDDIECESFTVIFIYSLLVYEHKNYLQEYLDICSHEIIDKRMINYLDDSLFGVD